MHKDKKTLGDIQQKENSIVLLISVLLHACSGSHMFQPLMYHDKLKKKKIKNLKTLFFFLLDKT